MNTIWKNFQTVGEIVGKFISEQNNRLTFGGKAKNSSWDCLTLIQSSQSKRFLLVYMVWQRISLRSFRLETWVKAHLTRYSVDSSKTKVLATESNRRSLSRTLSKGLQDLVGLNHQTREWVNWVRRLLNKSSSWVNSLNYLLSWKLSVICCTYLWKSQVSINGLQAECKVSTGAYVTFIPSSLYHSPQTAPSHKTTPGYVWVHLNRKWAV